MYRKRIGYHLEFKALDLDTIVSYWWMLEEAFDAELPVSLEWRLFYNAPLMEVQHLALSL